MKRLQMALWLALLPFWTGLALAAEGSGPGAMGGGGGMMDGGGMTMGAFMIVPLLFGLLLIATFILTILALIKYLRSR